MTRCLTSLSAPGLQAQFSVKTVVWIFKSQGRHSGRAPALHVEGFLTPADWAGKETSLNPWILTGFDPKGLTLQNAAFVFQVQLQTGAVSIHAVELKSWFDRLIIPIFIERKENQKVLQHLWDSHWREREPVSPNLQTCTMLPEKIFCSL